MRRSRRRVLSIDDLEDRCVPAVAGNLFVQGTTLVYAGNDLNNAISVSGTAAALTIDDAAGTIVSSVPGFTNDPLGGVIGTVPSGITNIALNGNNGVDSITVPASGLSVPMQNLSLTAEMINIVGPVIALSVTRNDGPVTDLNPAPNFLFSSPTFFPPGATAFNITDGAVIGGTPTLMIASGQAPPSFPFVNVANKTAITINTSVGVAPVAQTITLNNPTRAAGLNTLTIQTGSGNATINATATPAVVNTAITTGAGNDTFNVTAAGLGVGSSFSVNGGPGNNTLNVDAGGMVVDASTPGVIAVAGAPPINYANFQSVKISNAADPPLAPVSQTINTTTGTPLNNVNAGSFTDADPSSLATQFMATINWGDGTPPTVGNVVKDADPTKGFDVLGTHTYAGSGIFTIIVTASDPGNTQTLTVGGVPVAISDNGGNVTIGSTANVSPVIDLTPAPSFLFSGPNFFPLSSSAFNVTDGPVIGGTPTLMIASGQVPATFPFVEVANKTAITINTGGDGPVAQTITLNNPTRAAGLSTLTILTSSGNATINAAATPAGVNTAIVTGAGNDTFNVTAAGLGAGGSFAVNGGPGNNTLNVDAGGMVVDASKPGVISIAGKPPITYANVQSVKIINAADPPLSPVSQTINTTAGTPLNNVNAGSFTDADPTSTANQFAAAINWGDGTPLSLGTVVKDADPTKGFDVLGSHTYANAGTFSISVTASDSGNTQTLTVGGVPISISDNGGRVTIPSTAKVAPPVFQPLIVITTADLVGGVPVPGSLRDNLLRANAHPGSDTIIFDIVPHQPVETIKLDAPLPTITDPVTIDATTQPGYAGRPIVVLDGSAVSGCGLLFAVGSSTVRGMAVGGFPVAGIALTGGGGNLIANDYLGTDASGATALSNGIGVLVQSGSSNTIGGTAAGAGNVISGNRVAGIYVTGSATTGTVIAGNRIGTDLTGTAPVVRPGATDPLNFLQNTGVVIVGSQGNTIGGTTAAAQNLISGNYVGVMISGTTASGSPNRVQGNLIGTDASGLKPLGNIVGVYLNGAAGDQVVGNTISGNSSVGVQLFGPGTRANLIQGNLIGPAADGHGVFRGANGTFIQQTGVFVEGASGNTIGGASGAGNTIAGNQMAGVFLLSRGGTASGNVVQGNVLSNAGYGVLLYNAPNNQVDRVGPAANQFRRNGIMDFQDFRGPLPANSALGRFVQAGSTAHPRGPVHPAHVPAGHARRTKKVR